MINYIIVGRGIAGSAMALELLKNKKSFIVIDESSLSSCSKVAAGLYNPIVFKRLTKSWNIDVLLPAAIKFYSEAEQLLNQKFFYQKNIVKLFSEEQEKILWQKKSAGNEKEYLSPLIKNEPVSGCLHAGDYAEVKQSGYLDVGRFLNSLGSYLQKNNLLQEEKFDYSLLKINSNNVSYGNINAERIIFCEGYRAAENPYFPPGAFKLTKGEVLTVKIENFQSEKIINKGVFILPVGNNIYKVGATYEWNEINEAPTEKGKQELIEKLKKVISLPFEIIEHKAGIRPTIVDRRPALGTHHAYKFLSFLNGMGTKGVIHAPHCAQLLFNHIQNNEPIEAEVNISRFY